MEPDKLKRPDKRERPEHSQYRPDTEVGTCRKRSIAFGLLPDRPDSGSGPDPCGLGASVRCVIEFPVRSEKGPEKKSCHSGAGVGIYLLNR
jgi:hypothetical protein